MIKIKQKLYPNDIIEYDLGIRFIDAQWSLINDQTFRTLCTKILVDVPFEHYYAFFGKIGQKGYENNNFKIFVKKFDNKFKNENFSTYEPYFEKRSKISKNTRAILNLGKDALLIVPNKLKEAPKNTYLDIANFMRYAPIKQIHDLWIHIAALSLLLMNIRNVYNDKTGAIWISTHGSGVPFLHIRLDTSPKYLDWVPNIDTKGSGKWSKYMSYFQ